MGRKKDVKIWQEFEQMGRISKCKHCKIEFKGKPSVSRLRKHLLGVKDGGICSCEKVPDQIKAALLDDPSKRRRVDPSSVNNGMINSTSTSSQHQHTHLEHELHGGQATQEAVQDVEKETGQFQMFAEMLEQDINHELVDLGTHSGVVGDPEPRGVPFSQVELVGEEVADSIEEICSSLLIDEEVFRIGIYGMGGVGKTELAAHVHDKLLQDPKVHHVYWVEVTPDFSILSLQNDIAKAVNLNLLNENVERKRAGILRKALMQNKPFVLFLDDVWSYIPLQEVGVPFGLNCKLVLTTRSQDICRKMSCQKKIEVQCLRTSSPLTKDWILREDWELFTKILGPERSLPPEVEEVAKSLVWRCGGLPLMIKCIATTMGGEDDIWEWRSALKAMEGSKWSKDNRQVFQCLKRSYDHLQDPILQQCFLYIPLLGDLHFDREEIIMRLIAEGIIDERSWQEKVNEGYALFNKLQKDYLLTFHYKMHELVRNMAFQIMKEGSVPSLAEINKGLEDLPDKRHWTNDLVRVSLAGNNFKEISCGHLPICPNLSTLILCGNQSLLSITNCFFSQLPGLKVLDLSYTAIYTLPESIGCLQNLTALFLRGCENLMEMPSLAMLGSLEVLDLYCSGIRKVPQGLESLSNLKYLNLFETQVEEFSEGILTNLTRLEFLAIGLQSKTSSTKILEELTCLPELENLRYRFTNFQEFQKYMDGFSMMSTKKKMERLKIYVGPCFWCEESVPIGQTMKFSNCDISGRVSLPHKVEVVEMFEVSLKDGRGLCLQNGIGLKTIKIIYCKGIEYLFSLSSSTSIFQSLQTVFISGLNHLQLLFGAEAVENTRLYPLFAPFFNLRSFTIDNCPRMKKLFPFALIDNLQNLETLEVSYCDGIEEIITAQELDDTTGAKLPHLKHLELRNLPNLKKVCSTQLECDSLHKITIVECKELKDVPISLPLPSLQKFVVWPEEWWASVSWDHLDQKNALKPNFSHL